MAVEELTPYAVVSSLDTALTRLLGMRAFCLKVPSP